MKAKVLYSIIVSSLFFPTYSMSQSPNWQWVKSLVSLGFNDFLPTLALDSLNNLYTVGRSSGTDDFDPGKVHLRLS